MRRLTQVLFGADSTGAGLPHQRWLHACEVVCEVCGRAFRREGDKKRHKCTRERSKPSV